MPLNSLGPPTAAALSGPAAAEQVAVGREDQRAVGGHAAVQDTAGEPSRI